LFVYLSVCLSLYPSIHPSIDPSISVFCARSFTGVRGELLLGGAVVDVGDADADDRRRAHADEQARGHEDGQVERRGDVAGVVPAAAATRRRAVAAGAETVDGWQLVGRPVRGRRELRHEERDAAETDRQQSGGRGARPVNPPQHHANTVLMFHNTLPHPRGDNSAMLPWKLKAVTTPPPKKTLLHMPANAVCRRQMSPNRLVAGTPP